MKTQVSRLSRFVDMMMMMVMLVMVVIMKWSGGGDDEHGRGGGRDGGDGADHFCKKLGPDNYWRPHWRPLIVGT